MDYKSIWKWLDIEPTDNRDEIKQAYARQAKVYHPEEHPEEFQMLRNAYQTAMKRLKKPQSVVTGDLKDKTRNKKAHSILTEEIEMELMKIPKQQVSHDTEKDEKNKSEKPEKFEKPEKTEKPEKFEKPDQPEKPEKTEKSEQPIVYHVEPQSEPQSKPQSESQSEPQSEPHDDNQSEDEDPLELNFDYNDVYHQLWLEKKEEYLQQVLCQIRKLRLDAHRMNLIVIWKSILGQEQSRVLYNQKDFSVIIKEVLWGICPRRFMAICVL